jgi:alpha-L-fucosidase
VKLPPIAAKVIGSRVFTGGQATIRQTEAGLEVSVPEKDRNPLDTIVALDLDRPALGLKAVNVPSPEALSSKARATASNVYHQQAEFGPGKAVDNNDETRWATDAGVKSAWLELDLGEPKTFSRAVIRQAFPELKRIRKFAVEYLQDGEWKACHQGTNLGPTLTARFQPVTAQRVRLNITEATDGPTIWEFQLFK